MEVSYEAAEAAARLLARTALQHHGAGGRASAALLLAWWNGESNGCFDIAELWAADMAHREAMITCLAYAATQSGTYPTAVGVSREEIEAIIGKWRAGHSRDAMWDAILSNLYALELRVEERNEAAAGLLRQASGLIGRARNHVGKAEAEAEVEAEAEAEAEAAACDC